MRESYMAKVSVAKVIVPKIAFFGQQNILTIFGEKMSFFSEQNGHFKILKIRKI
jgi:hypothetical protein